MQIDCLILGLYETNCYVLRTDEHAQNCVIIDPGFEAEALVRFCEEGRLNPLAILLTHGHIDHIAGIEALKKQYPHIQLCIHELDAAMLCDPASNLGTLMGQSFTTGPAHVLFQDNQTFEKAGLALRILHTPGHTPGGICFYSPEDGVVFSNDTLFSDSIGRSDFPGGHHEQLVKSIREKLFTLPDNTVVYPGHGSKSTIGQEKTTNPFLR